MVAKFVERKCHFRSLVQRCLIALNRIPLFGTKKVYFIYLKVQPSGQDALQQKIQVTKIFTFYFQAECLFSDICDDVYG